MVVGLTVVGYHVVREGRGNGVLLATGWGSPFLYLFEFILRAESEMVRVPLTRVVVVAMQVDKQSRLRTDHTILLY